MDHSYIFIHPKKVKLEKGILKNLDPLDDGEL